MADEVASLYARISGDTSGLTSALAGAKSQVMGFGGGLAQGLGLGFIGASATAMGMLVANGVNQAIASLKALGQEALQNYTSFELVKQSMNQLVATSLLQAGASKDMAGALAMANVPGKELLDWAQKLAIESPFRLQDVTGMMQLAMSMGFTVTEAKRASTGFADWAAASGKTGAELKLVQLNLGQVASMGKLSGRELRDFAMHGLPALSILADAFGVTTAAMQEMVSAGTVPAGKAIQAILGYMETNFAGTAKRMSTTWAGLLSSFADVKELDMRALTGGIFAAIQPDMAKLVSALSSPEMVKKFEEIGNKIGRGFTLGLGVIKDTLPYLQTMMGLLAEGSGRGFNLATAFVNVAQAGARIGIEITAGLANAKAGFEMLGVVAQGIVEVIAAKFNMLMMGIKTAFAAIQLGVQAAFEMDPTTSSTMLATAGEWMTNAKTAFTGIATAGTDAWGRVTSAAAEYQTKITSIEKSKLYAIAGLDQLSDAAKRVSYYDPTKAKQVRMGSGGGLDEDTGGQIYGNMTPKQRAAYDALNAAKATESGLSEGLDKSKKAVDEWANYLKGELSSAVQDSIKLGVVPGTNPTAPNAPGANGAFEDLFRIQDIALNAGKPGKDTAKWMEMYGMDQEQAKKITEKFQMGLFDADVLKYVNKDKLKEQFKMKQLAEASQQALMEELGVASSGKGAAVMKTLMGFGTDAATGAETAPDAKPAVDGLLTSFATQLTAEAERVAGLGAQLFGGVKGGFLASAENDLAFMQMIEKMVAAAIKGAGKAPPEQNKK